ncbi:unnamed protein product [Spirodela intermedia]|uniref:Uncharacterized protein n=2 Tax=Spirodela intermedia TaxID=51605 RepID=A0A7I8LJ07_SPIIN|nr:unnamed protein product [Spirodela intermedia]CAA6672802.1 unnamed protein product [Spirodela intermedia]CAA7410021.1 unnamed protein product [Spirodela intermedia]
MILQICFNFKEKVIANTYENIIILLNLR